MAANDTTAAADDEEAVCKSCGSPVTWHTKRLLYDCTQCGRVDGSARLATKPKPEPPAWVKDLRRALAVVSVNYGIRARCRETLNLGPDPLSKEICEAREDGASECNMAFLRTLAPIFQSYAEELRFIETGGDDEGEQS